MFLDGPSTASFSFIFVFFKQTLQFLQQQKCDKSPTSIWCWDLNPRTSGYETPTITTRPGAPRERDVKEGKNWMSACGGGKR